MQIGMRQVSSETVEWFRPAGSGSGRVPRRLASSARGRTGAAALRRRGSFCRAWQRKRACVCRGRRGSRCPPVPGLPRQYRCVSASGGRGFLLHRGGRELGKGRQSTSGPPAPARGVQNACPRLAPSGQSRIPETQGGTAAPGKAAARHPERKPDSGGRVVADPSRVLVEMGIAAWGGTAHDHLAVAPGFDHAATRIIEARWACGSPPAGAIARRVLPGWTGRRRRSGREVGKRPGSGSGGTIRR